MFWKCFVFDLGVCVVFGCCFYLWISFLFFMDDKKYEVFFFIGWCVFKFKKVCGFYFVSGLEMCYIRLVKVVIRIYCYNIYLIDLNFII